MHALPARQRRGEGIKLGTQDIRESLRDVDGDERREKAEGGAIVDNFA